MTGLELKFQVLALAPKIL